MQTKNYSVDIGGKTITAEFTDLAEQAHGSVILRCGNTAVLATAVMSKNAKEGQSFFPLTVDYEERFYAAGEILGSRFVRREGRPSEEAILSGRVVDRTIRPLFPSHLRNEVHVVITTLSIDEYDPDVLAVNAASLALATSNIPWGGPVSAVRVGRLENLTGFEVNPSYLTRSNADYKFDMVACGKDNCINMIEVGAKEIPEEMASEAFEKASSEIERMQEFQKKIVSEIGKEKIKIEKPKLSEEETALFDEHISSKIYEALFSGPGKKKINELEEEWLSLFGEKFKEGNKMLAVDHFEETINDLIHKEAIEKGKRADGRGLNELRELQAKAGGFSPALHGSGIFYRGGTHVFTALTLGGPQDSLLVDSMEEREMKKRFMHHYNFPPYSSGETGRMGGLNRRMIGHGALAEKALEPVIPSKEIFPYTIRLVSECFASNGSTSMASTCAGTLALMDGGVPIKAPVAGIAIGLMMSFDYAEDKKYAILTDIQGPEDHHGDMDFKVAGTKEGITAIQLDVKVNGIPLAILKEALDKGKAARVEIIEVIEKAIPKSREDISPRAPKIVVTKIRPDQIGGVIGSAGKTINEIRELTGTEIEIEDDGTVFITGKDGGAEKALKIIEEMTREYKAGDRFEGMVTRLMDFGAFVKIGHNTEGLVHISEIAPFRIDRVDQGIKEGDKVPVIVKEIDEKGRINLSIKSADPTFAERSGFTPGVGGATNGNRREKRP